jgi:cobalt-precorrin-5B (C1)-methyltransferase
MSEFTEPPPGPLRTGFTTGACAAAAATAALRALLSGRPVETAVVALPIGRTAEFRVARCVLEPGRATCGVVKDAGDDPDVTHGAEIRVAAEVADRFARAAESAVLPLPGGGELHVRRGAGVGLVTLPGLEVAVGEPAVNPVPRRMLVAAAAGALAEFSAAGRSAALTISIPGGEEIAKKTLNARLGILGGLSILGTTGIVVPYSNSAWIAAVHRAVEVAVAVGHRALVATVGGKSEEHARRLIALPDLCFVEMGVFVGALLSHVRQRPIDRLTFVGMIGKWSKFAAGHENLSSREHEIDRAVLAEIAAECGATPEQIAAIEAANTAGAASEAAGGFGWKDFHNRLCRRCCRQARARLHPRTAVEFVLIDRDGAVLGRAEETA